ncbi:FecR family protein [Cerasicoccus frondis]|uniref:FecR family protein n=1 Tax=Cerasicoccus frondis TaxID=490090 RepID=UPI002852B342|nr:FecR domain-containing protein [Cerasicoccus frondis]
MKMIKYFIFWLACVGVLSAGMVETPTVQVYLVKGDVTLIDIESGEKTPLQRGDLISEGYAIETGSNSSALLLFSNGSSINVVPDSYVKIAEFTQEPFDLPVKNYALMGEDPSKSTTTLELHYGKVVGSVRKLQPESSYTINSPTGSAGIRGTTFVFATLTKSDAIDASNGDLSSTVTVLSVGEGEVVLKVGAKEYTVKAGETVSIPVSIGEGEGGTLEITVATDDVPNENITAADQQAIDEMAGELEDAQNNTFLVSPGADEGDLVLTPLRTGNTINLDGGIINPTSAF